MATRGERSDGSIPAVRWEGASADHWAAAWGAPRVDLFRRIGSTNDHARRIANAGAPAGTVVLADEQTEGRGRRRGRTWHAPAGAALLYSIILRPEAVVDGPVAPGVAALRIGLAAARAIERCSGATVHLKWPNDLVVPDYGKVAGVLCEGSLGARGAGLLVAGIGANVHQQPRDWPAEIRSRATSLAIATGRAPRRSGLAGAITREIRRAEADLVRPLDGEVARALADRDALAGRTICVLDDETRGIARGIAADGALRLEVDGAVRHVRHGTVRPAS